MYKYVNCHFDVFILGLRYFLTTTVLWFETVSSPYDKYDQEYLWWVLSGRDFDWYYDRFNPDLEAYTDGRSFAKF